MTLKLSNYAALNRENCLNTLPLQDSETALTKMFIFTEHSDSLTHTYRVPEDPGPLEETIKVSSQCLKDF